jgi:hypothetical protein
LKFIFGNFFLIAKKVRKKLFFSTIIHFCGQLDQNGECGAGVRWARESLRKGREGGERKRERRERERGKNEREKGEKETERNEEQKIDR